MKSEQQGRVRGHRQRLRQRFLAGGLDGFADYEVIELLLTLGTPRKDCKPAAKQAIKRFKTLQAVLNASNKELAAIDGIGPNNIFGLKLIPAIAQRYLQQKLIGKDPILNARQLFDYMYLRLRDKPRECFETVFLDAKNRVIATEILFEGTLTSSAVYPREVITAALGHRAAALIFAHNHPSGDPSPSQADIDLTRRLIYACRPLDIAVQEHLIIGDNRYYSFAEQGLIARMQKDVDVFMGVTR